MTNTKFELLLAATKTQLPLFCGGLLHKSHSLVENLIDENRNSRTAVTLGMSKMT